MSLRIRTKSGEMIDLKFIRARARTKLEMWSYYVAQEGQLIHRDLEAVLDALEAILNVSEDVPEAETSWDDGFVNGWNALHARIRQAVGVIEDGA